MNTALLLAISALLIVVIVVLIVYLVKTDKAANKNRPYHKLTRHEANPVISPGQTKSWEQNGTFNPAAIKDDEGKVHLLYRALGADGLSRVGHSSSTTGKDFGSNRSMYPVFEPRPGYGLPDPAKVPGPKLYDPSYYTSGGGWGGS
ncbi:MAG: hypothetical protein WCT02_02825, partial [Candidatus Paceibacterota bacterium]